jgi:ribosomal protein S18 acetylase RimI-like enzyme
MVVRPLTSADGMVLKDVRLRALRDAPLAFTQTVAEVEHDPDHKWVEWAAEMSVAGGDSATYLAFDDDPAVAAGMAGGFLDREDPAEAVVWGVWVDPASRGSGVGRELVSAVIDWAAARGCERVTLCVTDTSDAAITLYRELGFSEHGPRRPHRHLPSRTETSMIKVLAAP